MTRFRPLALSITLAFLAAGCYTQLRPPHASSHHRDIRVPARRAPVWRHHRPIFHTPVYSHYDGWLYGDAYCDIWVDRYYDYHPWFPRHSVQFFYDVHAHPGYNSWRGSRYTGRFWSHDHDRYGRYGRHRGPRFEPLSPTVDVQIEVVERRGKFRRSGFSGGIPTSGEDVVTMQGASADANGQVATQTVRVTRPGKIRRMLGNTPAVIDEGNRGLLNQEITWESWQERRQGSTTQRVPGSEKQSGWGDTGRDLQAWGTASEGEAHPARQPKPQTNWFSSTGGEETAASAQTGKPDLSWRTAGTDGAEAGEPDVRSDNPVSGAWSSGVTHQESVGTTNYASPKKEVGRKDRVDSDQRRDDAPRPAVREPEPVSRTWAETKKEKREKPRPTYATPPKKQQKKERVSRASDGASSQKKATEKKEDEEKETRQEKRKKARKRRGM